MDKEMHGMDEELNKRRDALEDWPRETADEIPERFSGSLEFWSVFLGIAEDESLPPFPVVILEDLQQLLRQKKGNTQRSMR